MINSERLNSQKQIYLTELKKALENSRRIIEEEAKRDRELCKPSSIDGIGNLIVCSKKDLGTAITPLLEYEAKLKRLLCCKEIVKVL
jgi:hypothetical protein